MGAMEKEIPGPAVKAHLARSTGRKVKIGLITAALITGWMVFWSVTRQQEATLEIRAAQEGISLPDGFFVWHHLDASGIAFKSIIPHRKGLVIRCMNNMQCEAARLVLSHKLPQGYILALSEQQPPGHALLARLRINSHKMG